MEVETFPPKYQQAARQTGNRWPE